MFTDAYTVIELLPYIKKMFGKKLMNDPKNNDKETNEILKFAED